MVRYAINWCLNKKGQNKHTLDDGLTLLDYANKNVGLPIAKAVI